MSALGRFPLLLLCGLAATAAAIAYVASDGAERYLRIALTATLGMPLFFSLHLLGECGKRRWMRLAALSCGVLLLAAYYHWLIPAPSDWWDWLPMHFLPAYVQIHFGWIAPPFYDWPMLVGMGWWLAFAGLAFLAATTGSWQFNWLVFVRFWRATAYSGVLLAGLETALSSADKLFELHLENSYVYLLLIMTGCFLPAAFLLGVPRDCDAVPPRWPTAFAQFALAPFVAVYTVMLYAAAINVILARTWPHGFEATPVFILAGAGIGCAVLLRPLQSIPGEKWARWYCKNFPRALAPLCLPLLMSIWERVAADGVTEYRYLGVVFGFWIVAWALVCMIRPDDGIRWIPASLAVICLAAAIGPWSAGTISRNSQYGRLTQLFRAHGLMIADEFHPPREALELPGSEAATIRSIINYLASVHGGESMHQLFAGIWKEEDWDQLTPLEAEVMWFKLNLKDQAILVYDLKRNETANIEGFRQVTLEPHLFDIKGVNSPDALTLRDGRLWMKTSGEASPEPVPSDAFLESLRGKKQFLPSAQLILDWTQKGRPFRIIFKSLLFRREAGKPPYIRFCICLLCEG